METRHLRSIWAIVRKDLLEIWLNKSSLIGLLYPIIMSLLFFLITHVVGSSSSNLLIYNPGNSALAQAVSAALPNTRVVQAASPEEVQAAFGPDGTRKKSSYMVGLIIPDGFDASLRAGEQPEVSLFVNGSTLNAQAMVLPQAVIINYARTVAQPEAPVKVLTTTINPTKTGKAGIQLNLVYLPLTLLLSLTVGTIFIPNLLLEEKEKKTLRMLLVSPATFRDILIAKLLVVLVFQLAMTCVVLVIQNGFTGAVPLVLLYVLVGACFSLALGLFFGSVFNSTASAGSVGGIAAIVFILGGLFVGQLGQLLGTGIISQLVRLLPTYYLADGVVNAAQNLGSISTHLLDFGVVLGSTVVLLGIAGWALRRQSAVLAIV